MSGKKSFFFVFIESTVKRELQKHETYKDGS